MNKSKNSFFIVVTFYFILNCDAVFSQTGNITTDQDGKLIYNNVTVVTPQPTENEIQQRNYEKEKYLKKNCKSFHVNVFKVNILALLSGDTCGLSFIFLQINKLYPILFPKI